MPSDAENNQQLWKLIGQMSEALPLLHKLAGEMDHIERRVGRLESQYEHEVLPALRGGFQNTTSDSQNALVVNARFKNWKWPVIVLGASGTSAGLAAWGKDILAGIASALPH